MKIDTMSILLALTILCSGFTVAMLLAWRMLLPMRSLLFWAGGMGCYAAGLILLNTRDILPDFFSMLLANLLLLLYYCFLWAGFSLYRSKPPQYLLMALLISVFVPVYSWFVWITPDISARTAIVRVFMLIPLAGTFAAFQRNRTSPLTMIEKLVTERSLWMAPSVLACSQFSLPTCPIACPFRKTWSQPSPVLCPS